MKKRLWVLLGASLLGVSCVSKQGSLETEAMEISAEAAPYKENIRRSIKQELPKVKSCYNDVLKSKADKASKLEGKIVMAWEINPEGKVVNARVKSDTVGHPELQKCVIQAITETQFPKTPDNQVVDIVGYPLFFNETQK